jgi:hypothetical protein
MERWSKCNVLIEMALVVHDKNFISEILEKELNEFGLIREIGGGDNAVT